MTLINDHIYKLKKFLIKVELIDFILSDLFH